MNPQNEILRIFKSLADKEKRTVLKELKKASIAGADRPTDSLVSCCPHCESKKFVKNGHRGACQNYKCKACFKIFTSNTGTSMHGIHKLDKFELFKSLMLDTYYPLTKIAIKVGISTRTAFDWRHKILSGMLKENKSFEGITEIDDIWFLYSQKGRKGLKYSRKRGGSSRAGDNNFQAKL